MADKKIQEFTADLDIIAKLDDEPNDVGGLSSADLKARFDKAGNLIKSYLNDSLIPDIEGTGPDAPGIIGEDIKKHNEAPDSHANIRDEIAQNKQDADTAIALKLDSATIKSAGIPEISSAETLRSYFYDRRKETSRSWQFEVSTGNNENMISALGGFPDGHTAAEKWFLYINLPYTEAGGFVIHAQLEGRDNGLLYRQDQFATLDQRWHGTGWIRIQDVQANLDEHMADPDAHPDIQAKIKQTKFLVLNDLGAHLPTSAETPSRAKLDDIQVKLVNDLLKYYADGGPLVLDDGFSKFSSIGSYRDSMIGTNRIAYFAGSDGNGYRVTLFGLDAPAEYNFSVDIVKKQDILTGGAEGQVLTQTRTGEPQWADPSALVVSIRPDQDGLKASASSDEIRRALFSKNRTVVAVMPMELPLRAYTAVHVEYASSVPADPDYPDGYVATFTSLYDDTTSWIKVYPNKNVKTGVTNNRYTLPTATADTLGGIKAPAKTAEQTQPIGIDADGTLWAEAGGGEDATAEKWATVAVKEALADITDEATFRSHFYNLRKAQSRKFQFEISEGGIHENIVTGVGGRPSGADARDRAFIYVDIPYSEAGGYIIHVVYEMRDKVGLWEKTIYATLNYDWKDTGWLAAEDRTPLVVTVDREGGGGYKADYNSSDILAAAQAHRAVIMRYTDTDSGLQTDILLKGQSGGLPLFYDTWLSKDGKTVNRIDATVDYNSNVNVTQSSVPAIPAGGTVGQFLVSDGAGGVSWLTLPNLDTEAR